MHNILLLEDDDNFREIVADLLSGEGYVVVEAASAQKAIELSKLRHFHLVLSDVRMAGSVDGVGAIEAIQEIRPGIRSIVMTGFADLDVPLRAARLQADDYLTKPFDLRSLSKTVRAVLNKRPEVPRGVLTRMLKSATQAKHWIFDRQLQEANSKRQDFYQSFFVLIRSQRISCEEAYPVFVELERVELSPASPAQAYVELQKRLLASLAGNPAPAASEGRVTRELFRRLFKRLQAGSVEVGHFQNALQLLHREDLRKADLQSYATYCWLWEEEPKHEQTDPFVGLRFGQFTLETCLLSAGQVRLYSLTRGKEPNPARILCFPIEQTTSSLQDEISSGRAEYLKEAYGHHILFYDGEPGVTMLARLIPAGTAWPEIWRLLRPLFVRLSEYHQAGICSGCLMASQVRLGPEGSVELVDFGPQLFQRAHFTLQSLEEALPAQVESLLCCAPEAMTRQDPSPRSDQFVAGRILLEALNVPSPGLRILDENGCEDLWESLQSQVGTEVTAILRRLCHFQPGARFGEIREAMEALDQISR